MKKLILSVALICCITYLNAQDEAVIQLFYSQKQYEKAKEQVDKWLATPKIKDKDKATASLWKLLVYSSLYTDPSLSQKYPDAADQALMAFDTYQVIEPGLKQLKDQHFEGGIGNIYSGYFEKGKTFFNNKQWDSAYKYFYKSEKLGSLLLTNNLSASTAKLDTVTVLYTAYSAQNAKLLDTAAVYYGKLADLRVGGPDYEDIYKYLVQYNFEKKNDAVFKKYLATAKELYPNENTLWTQYEMNAMTSNSSVADLLQRYQQESAAGSLNEDKLIAYAEAFVTNDSTQLTGMDSLQKVNAKMTGAQAYAKAFDANNTNGLYAFNVGVIYYSMYNALDDRYVANRGESATLKAKRAEINKQERAYADTAAQWLEKAYPVLKAKQDRARVETSSLNRAVDYLANIYYWMRDQTKVNNTPKDYDKYDALYKKYDAEHNSYK